MKAILTNKENPEIKAVYANVLNVSVQQFHNIDLGYDGSPMWILELPGFDNTASFHCSDWSIEIQ